MFDWHANTMILFFAHHFFDALWMQWEYPSQKKCYKIKHGLYLFGNRTVYKSIWKNKKAMKEQKKKKLVD